ncbi:ubiquitin carboxyl-terminal hydrolase CYLD isoform X2 [Electrophorus electricus]|uniref:ubiquitin carboxyl-terminal hydrolase CYLD isoform X2 n=1 Tax=Electrophorus electricus TaxID=8005 RepID=UPI0015CFC0B6|nr:ubiquitin carboxyl-terminal hydrolase CYLD isoform X2 [Electrophorus electricus]
MASSDKNIYFIITRNPASYKWNKTGRICYINKDKYLRQKKQKATTLRVTCIGDVYENTLPSDIVQELTQQEAELLLALDKDEARLEEIKLGEQLRHAVSLHIGSEVTVELNAEWLKGVVRYIGRLSDLNHRDPIVGVFFGVELQGQDKGKGQNSGSFCYKSYFQCPKDCGIFAPFNRIKPLHSKQSSTCAAPRSSLPEPTTEQLVVGDRVTYCIKDTWLHGMVLELDNEKGVVLISTDIDENGREGGEMKMSLDHVIKEADFNKDETEMMEIPEMANDLGTHGAIGLGSMVEVLLGKGPVRATVCWMGHLPGLTDTRVGLELEEDYGVNDGTFRDVRYFTCPAKRGLFVKLSSCRPDARFLGDSAANRHFDHDGQDASAPQANVPPVASEDVLRVLIGRMKGIQGHCNSCYMDSALFSLFSCSSVVDSLLFKRIKRKDEAIQKTILRDIVCPLRRDGFVAAQSVMKLRQLLQARGHCPSYTTDEKDPEEFLTLIMQEVLCLEPPLKLKSFSQAKGILGAVESSYFYQIFVDYNNCLILPTVQQLLEQSFHSSGVRLAEIPSCLILTMPRSGKQFKMFPKIIPSLELDITGLLSDGPQQCVICGELAYLECSECLGESVFSNTGFKHFCEKCSTQVHSHPCRQRHKPACLHLPEGFPRHWGPSIPPREKLELFAVLCIETSHYVSFVKHGPKATDWIFFDSMADRQVLASLYTFH